MAQHNKITGTCSFKRLYHLIRSKTSTTTTVFNRILDHKYLPTEIRVEIFRLYAVQELQEGFRQPLLITALEDAEKAWAKARKHHHKPSSINLYHDALAGYRQVGVTITVDNLTAFNALRRPQDWVRSVTFVWAQGVTVNDPILDFTGRGLRLKPGNDLNRITLDLTKLRKNECHCHLMAKWLVDFSGRMPIEGSSTIRVSMLVNPTISAPNIETHWVPSFSRMFQKKAERVDVDATLREWVWEDEKTVMANRARSYPGGDFKTC